MSIIPFDLIKIPDKAVAREFYHSSIEDYEYERQNYKLFNRNMCEYVESKLENNTIAVSNAQCSEILKHFHILRCKLNPEKYSNKHVLHGNLTNVNLMKFCYYISNVLVCLSHDIVYAINKELKTLPNYNGKNKT